MDVRNTGGNKYETTAREIQNYQFSTFFDRSKMTSRKVTATALKVNVKKFRPTSTSSLACVLTNLDAFCPMEVHLPGEKSILPYFSSLRGVAISVPFPEVRNRKGTESGHNHTCEKRGIWGYSTRQFLDVIGFSAKFFEFSAKFRDFSKDF